MRRLGPTLSLAGGALLLASLYMPWVTPSCAEPPATSRDAAGLGALLGCYDRRTVDGWATLWGGLVGSATALAALGLAALAILALVRPAAGRFPLLVAGLFASYFAVANGAVVRSAASYGPGASLHFGYGAFVWGLALCLVLGGLAMTWSGRRLSLSPAWRVAAALPAGALAVLLLFPWIRITGVPEPVNLVGLGVDSQTGVVVAALAVLLLAGWWSEDPAVRWERAGLSAALVVFVGGAFSLPSGFSDAGVVFALTWGAWAGLAVALALLALTLALAVRARRPTVPCRFVLVAGAAAGLFAVSEFLPWRTLCFNADSGAPTPDCLTFDGWTSSGSASLVLAFALVLLAFRPSRLATPPVDVAAVLGLLLVTAVLRLHQESFGPDVAYDVRPGALLGLAAGGALVVLFLAMARPEMTGRSRAPARFVPVACCALYLAIYVLPSWEVLPDRIQNELVFTRYSWIYVPVLLLAVRLLDLWARRAEDDPADLLLVAFPLSLLALAAVDIARYHEWRPHWGSGVVVALGLVLAILGHVENTGGIRQVQIPEVLRVDRL